MVKSLQQLLSILWPAADNETRTISVTKASLLAAMEQAAEFGAAPYRKVLEEFVRDINDTGGVVRVGVSLAPSADLGWTDLGVTYKHACSVLQVPMEIQKDEEDG